MQHSQFELFILVLLLRALVTGKIKKRLHHKVDEKSKMENGN